MEQQSTVVIIWDRTINELSKDGRGVADNSTHRPIGIVASIHRRLNDTDKNKKKRLTKVNRSKRSEAKDCLRFI